MKLRGFVKRVPVESVVNYRRVLYKDTIRIVDEIFKPYTLSQEKFPNLFDKQTVVLRPATYGLLGDDDQDSIPIVTVDELQELVVEYEYFELNAKAQFVNQPEARVAYLSTKYWEKIIADGLVDSETPISIRIHQTKASYEDLEGVLHEKFIAIATLLNSYKRGYHQPEVIRLLRDFRNEFCTTQEQKELLGADGLTTTTFNNWLRRNGIID